MKSTPPAADDQFVVPAIGAVDFNGTEAVVSDGIPPATARAPNASHKGKFYLVPNDVTDRLPEIGDAAHGLYCVLSRLTNRDGSARASIKTLCRRCRKSKRTVRSALRKLAAEGFLEVVRSTGRGNSNSYLLPHIAIRKGGVREPLNDGKGGVREPLSTAQSGSRNVRKVGPGVSERVGPGSPLQDVSSKRRVQDTPLPPLPASLAVGSVAELLEEFVAMRREMRKPLTPTSTKALFRMLERLGPVKAAEALTKSLTNQWQGVFDPDERKSNRNGKLEQSPVFADNVKAEPIG